MPKGPAAVIDTLRTARKGVHTGPTASTPARALEKKKVMCVTPCRVAQNARGVVKGVVKGVTRASFGRRAPLTPQLRRASARRREETVFMGVYMIQQAAVHLGWGQAPSLDTENDI